MLDRGKLRHRIQIERLQSIVDSNGDAIQHPVTGEVLREWALAGYAWASIEPVSAREFIQSQSMQSKIEVRIVIEWRADLEQIADTRFMHTRRDMPSVYYNPAGSLPDIDSNREYLTVPCSRGVSDGR